MKNKIALLLLIFLVPFCVSAADKCEYTTGASTNNSYSVTITVKKTLLGLGGYYGDGYINNYEGEAVNSGSRVNVKDWDGNHQNCYTYASVSTSQQLSGNRYKKNYNIYVSDNQDDLKAYKGTIMVLSGSDASLTEDSMVSSCSLIYHNGFQDDDRKTDKIKDYINFSFNKYSSGSKEFCVTTNSKANCKKFAGSVAPVIEVTGKSGTSYKFGINSDGVNHFFGDTCLSNFEWSIDATASTFYLGYINIHNDDNDDDDNTEDDTNQDSNFSGYDVKDTTIGEVCNMPQYRKTMRFFGTIVTFAKYLVPIIIIAFGIMDLYKAVTGAKDDEIKKSFKSVMVRVAAGVFIFLLPGLVQFFFNMLNEWSDYKIEVCCCTECLLNSSCDTNSCSSSSCKIEGMNN